MVGLARILGRPIYHRSGQASYHYWRRLHGQGPRHKMTAQVRRGHEENAKQTRHLGQRQGRSGSGILMCLLAPTGLKAGSITLLELQGEPNTTKIGWN